MKKLIYLSTGLLCVMLLSINLSIGASISNEEASISRGHNYCYGYKWIVSEKLEERSRTYKIRCTCTGGSKCYAAWQEL